MVADSQEEATPEGVEADSQAEEIREGLPLNKETLKEDLREIN